MTYHATNTPSIGDLEILSWIKARLLIVRDDANWPIEVWKWHGSRRRYERLKVYSCDSDGRLRCNLRHGAKSNGGRQRTCYLNKLVWMYRTRQTVPAGYVLDHKNEICTDDSFDNLQLMTQKDSDRQGRTLQGSVNPDDEYGDF